MQHSISYSTKTTAAEKTQANVARLDAANRKPTVKKRKIIFDIGNDIDRLWVVSEIYSIY
jgi:hypothetical protein